MAKTKITVELSSLWSMGFVPAQVQIVKKGPTQGRDQSMGMRRCAGGHITQWSTSCWASLEDTGCCHVGQVLTSHCHGVDDFSVKHKTQTKTNFSWLTYGRPKPKVVKMLLP